MHVAVLGAGVTGVTTAYYLTENGHSVTVIDRAPEVAAGASWRNGGQLSYSFTEAFANPSLLRKLPGQILGFDDSIRVRPPINRHLINWGFELLGQCTRQKAKLNTIFVLRLAMQSSRLLKDIRESIPLEFSFRRAGKLVMLGTQAELNSARIAQELKEKEGCRTEILNFQQACDIEPGLNRFSNSYIGASWSKHDEVACPKKFCLGLSRWLMKNRGVEFLLNESIDQIETNGGRISRITMSSGSIEPDAAIVCLGVNSVEVLRPLGIKVNIYPLRGYSVTLPLGPDPVSASITDLKSKIVFSRLGDKIRIAGLADILGPDFEQNGSKHDEHRIRDLVEIAHSLAPRIADFNAKTDDGWSGVRPMTTNSRPIVGPTDIEGLFLNTGHGMLGWTLACATGHAVAGQVHATAA